jgi:hypothetical protein
MIYNNNKYNKYNFIIYNNRSQELVKKFIPKVNINNFLDLENKYIFIQNQYKNFYQLDIKFQDYDLNTIYDDIIFNKEELEELDNKLILSNRNIKKSKEYFYLKSRKITDDIIETYKIATLSSSWIKRELDVMGATLHPLLNNIFNNQISEGIIFPMYENNVLKNIVIRRLENGPVKYSFAIPEIDLYNIDKVNSDEIWITEGILDLIALEKQGIKNCVSASSSLWSSIQLYKILEKNIKYVNIFSDYDYTGLKNSLILKRFFNLYNIKTKIYISTKCKDAFEHFVENEYSWDFVEEIGITNELLEILLPDEKEKQKDYILYLKNKYIN